MPVGGVVDDEIDNDADAVLLGGVRELDEVAERTIGRIDVVIIGDVVAVVLAGRGLERHQPDRVDAEAGEVIEPPAQAGKIADAVAVRVHVGRDGEAIDDRVLVPEIVDHRLRLRQ